MTLFLVRHGRPLVEPDRPAGEWELDPAGFDDVWALRDQLPAEAVWFCSPETKAQQTAQLLTDGEVGVVEGLHEQVRCWVDDFDAVMERALAAPAVPAYDGWESLAVCRDRVATTVRRLLAERSGEDVVLIGHGTAWTLLIAELTGRRPTIADWRGWSMPDLRTVEPRS